MEAEEKWTEALCATYGLIAWMTVKEKRLGTNDKSEQEVDELNFDEVNHAEVKQVAHICKFVLEQVGCSCEQAKSMLLLSEHQMALRWTTQSRKKMTSITNL